MKTPEDWADDINSLYDSAYNSAVKDLVQEAMASVYEDILSLVAEDYVDDEGIAKGIRERMSEVFGDELENTGDFWGEEQLEDDYQEEWDEG